MEDGNTATSLAPSEDGEMAKVREIFERALNAIVSATQLAKEVNELRHDVGNLRSEVEGVRARNQLLDNELAATRDARDQALRDKQAAIEELNRTQTELERTHHSYQGSIAERERLGEQHEALKREHDTAQYRIMELEEENKNLKAQVEKIKAAIGIQPRDVESGQWQEKPHQPSAEQSDEPKTGTDPFWR